MARHTRMKRGTASWWMVPCMWIVSAIFGFALLLVDFGTRTVVGGSVALALGSLSLAASHVDGHVVRRRVWLVVAYVLLVTVGVIILRAFGITIL